MTDVAKSALGHFEIHAENMDLVMRPYDHDDEEAPKASSNVPQKMTGFPTLTLDLTDAYSVDVLHDLRENFMVQLAEVDVHKNPQFLHTRGESKGKLKHTAPKEGKFNQAQIHSIANLIFVEMLGEPAFTRLTHLVKWYNHSTTESPF
ncbi:hypothetical protein PV11_07241 [Exophiala sideris]|uniref:Uncharacterized protein n=1 Tax=Exophiala sideris TaxID=1016849 RepID=A0A0D1YFN3_9EURO|nr:hypothetical protein PV11_07241 [Exophiala sideris]